MGTMEQIGLLILKFLLLSWQSQYTVGFGDMYLKRARMNNPVCLSDPLGVKCKYLGCYSAKQGELSIVLMNRGKLLGSPIYICDKAL